MPLLLCPNDNASMSTVQRSGVEFDVCPTCRGVWLDRGELEKLLGDDRGGATPSAPPSGYGRGRPEFDDDDDHRRYGGHRKKRSSLFDIFD